MNFLHLQESLLRAGARKLYVKILASNDNSKQQVYFGPGFTALNIIPTKEIRAGGPGPDGTPRFKAALDFCWLTEVGSLVRAPDAQLILYPQYPEVRFSGFLRGARGAPNEIMRSREAGRALFLAVTQAGEVIGHVVPAESALAREIAEIQTPLAVGVFFHLPLIPKEQRNPRDDILEALRVIHRKGWIISKRLRTNGIPGPCDASNCGGYTLEAELGVTPNGYSRPDYKGWEVKSIAVAGFTRLPSKAVTLMTPEPTAGFYGEQGADAFVRRYGYPDKKAAGRLNFSSPHRAGVKNSRTRLTLAVRGFDAQTQRMTDASGGIDLVDEDGTCAATWPFAGLLKHWRRKHALAAYVPTVRRLVPNREYSYGHIVHLGIEADFQKLLSAFASGKAYYDPGIKMADEGSESPTIKCRSQFRVSATELDTLYGKFEHHDLDK